MSNALTEIVDYLVEKLTQPGKPSAGVTYIKDNYEVHEIPRLVDISFQIYRCTSLRLRQRLQQVSAD